MKIQELKPSGKPRNVPPKEVSSQFWDKLKATKVGARRFKVVPEKKEQPLKKEPKNLK